MIQFLKMRTFKTGEYPKFNYAFKIMWHKTYKGPWIGCTEEKYEYYKTLEDGFYMDENSRMHHPNSNEGRMLKIAMALE